MEREGRVVVTKPGARPAPATPGMGLVARDKLGTGESSRAVLKMSERWLARIDEETDVEITPGAFGAKDKDALKLALGGAFIYSREEEGEIKVQTPSATGGLRGTQVMVRVAADGKTWMQCLEGEVDLGNELGQVRLRAGEAGEAAMGQAPRKTAVIAARNLLQWALYYPAVLPLDEIGLTEVEKQSLGSSVTAYQQGDLPGALETYPRTLATDSVAGRLYHAAVLLAAGRVESARRQLAQVPVANTGRLALERLIAAAGGDELQSAGTPTTAGLALAESYYQQSRHQLTSARAAAQRATELAPQAGIAWVRLAELEFSFGRTREATRALERGLGLVPRHAQAHALRGFLFSADNRIAEAQEAFAKAVSLDGGLGQAWLGLGLTKIRQNRLTEGRADLQTAAVVEPTRSFYYSYHAKALTQAGATALARKDLALAQELDPNDPTPRLYAALLDQQENRYHAAIAEMQESLRLNDHRRVYRSQFLLDQDRAVRSANLAAIFRQDGLTEVAVREAARAVESDYGNASAHLFLANSFDALRDPDRFSLHHETAWFNEQLLASLLSPVGGGPLSQFVSQQEYSKLFEADRQGGSAVGQWRSDGRRDAQASWFTTSGRLAVGADLAYHRNGGERPNNDSTTTEGFLQGKYQVSPDDVAYGLGHWQRQTGGDLTQSYANTGDPLQRFEDRQYPGLLLAGWNHTWAPGVTTLVLGGRLAAKWNQTAPNTQQILLGRDATFLQPGLLTRGSDGALTYAPSELRNAASPPVALTSTGTLSFSPEFQRAIAPYLGRAPVTGVGATFFSYATRQEIAINTWELQQLWKIDRHTFLAGARIQAGEIDTTATLDLLNPSDRPLFAAPAAQQRVAADFGRRTAYAYAFSDVTPTLRLIAGASWDRIKRPENFRNPPINAGEVEMERASAKVGFTFSPVRHVAMRGMYTEAVGGVTFDESVRLEPVQLAGFDQTFRTVIPESMAGSVETPIYKLWGLGLDGNVAGRTWWSASGNVLREDVRRTVGSFDAFSAPLFPRGGIILPASTAQVLNYREEITALGVNQLLGDQTSAGVHYRRTRATLRQRFPQVPVTIDPQADLTDSATLNVVDLSAIWNSPAGWFARGDAVWRSESLSRSVGGRSAPAERGDHFWQFDLQAGIRFRRNFCEFSAGVLNFGNRNYRLSPLIYSQSIPRERTAVLRLRVSY